MRRGALVGEKVTPTEKIMSDLYERKLGPVRNDRRSKWKRPPDTVRATIRQWTASYTSPAQPSSSALTR